jgi:cephalosporin hydroxylase
VFNREEFEADKRRMANEQSQDKNLQKIAHEFLIESDKRGYAYHWTWLGLPIIQMPADIIATHEIIWQTKPDVIIETGVAWGGSIVMYASILELIGKGKVIGIDLNLMDHVEEQIMSYNFSKRIQLFKGSSVEPSLVEKVKSLIEPGQSVMVILDSNHTHEHVLDELRAFAPLVTKDQYLLVCDTYVEDVPLQTHRPRPWGPGNNPGTALREYVKDSDVFEVDEYLDKKILTTYTPGGYLKRVR